MVAAGIRPEALDEIGGIRWATEIAQDNGFALHAVSGLDPQQAMSLVGGKFLRDLAPGELPAQPGGGRASILHLAAGDGTKEDDLMVAGRGAPDWSFVFDLSGLSAMDGFFELAGLPRGGFRERIAADLPPGPRTKATYSCTVNGDGRLAFSEGNPASEFVLSWEELLPLHEFPVALQPAVEAAGAFGTEGEIDDEALDTEQGLRIICALAGLTWTPEEFRNQPLSLGYF